MMAEILERSFRIHSQPKSFSALASKLAGATYKRLSATLMRNMSNRIAFLWSALALVARSSVSS
jgi:hypothetical protein